MIEAHRDKKNYITFDDEWITLHRSLMSVQGRGEKRIHVSQVSAVQFKKAGFTGGFIEFTIPGGNEARSGNGRSQMSSASHIENAMTFSSAKNAEFQALRDAVESAIAARHSRP